MPKEAHAWASVARPATGKISQSASKAILEVLQPSSSRKQCRVPLQPTQQCSSSTISQAA